MHAYKLLIPAAGKGKRSGLDYPKCLHRIDDVPIIIHLIKKFQAFSKEITVIINPATEQLFTNCFEEFGIIANFIFQKEAHGMGDAILKASSAFNENDHIILVWSDIPFLSSGTIQRLINCHEIFINEFSFATWYGDNCYTIVERENGKLKAVLETKLLGLKPKEGERDIGLFIFKGGPVFKLLASNDSTNYSNGNNEHGFLYCIEVLANMGSKIEGYPISDRQDTLSFNTPENLQEIIHYNKNVSI